MTSMSSLSELIDEFERLDREATPGPWEHRPRGGPISSGIEEGLPDYWSGILSVPAQPFALGRVAAAFESDSYPSDAALIVALRNALPRIVALLKAGEAMSAALTFYLCGKHEGECEYTDKVDEGCYLCKEVENAEYPKHLAALAAWRAAEKGE